MHSGSTVNTELEIWHQIGSVVVGQGCGSLNSFEFSHLLPGSEAVGEVHKSKLKRIRLDTGPQGGPAGMWRPPRLLGRPHTSGYAEGLCVFTFFLRSLGSSCVPQEERAARRGREVSNVHQLGKGVAW